MQQKVSRPLFLGFASQKGGVGKSSLAEVLAAVLYYERGIPLVVMDCDATQESFYKLRERERDLIESDAKIQAEIKAYFTHLGKPSYTILYYAPNPKMLHDGATISRHTRKRRATCNL